MNHNDHSGIDTRQRQVRHHPAGDVQTLQALIRAIAVSQAIGTACEIGLPDALAPDESIPVSFLARQLDVNARALLRLCRMLAAFELFTLDKQGKLSHNSLSLMLRRGEPRSLHWAARFWTSPAVRGAWGDLRHAVATGDEGFRHAHGMSFFDYMNDHADQAEVYRQYMAGGYPGRHEAIAAALPLGKHDTVVDVGGGTGDLIRAILDQYADVRGIVYDQPDVIRSSAATKDSAIYCGRYRLVEGDFFDAVPSGGDIYLLSYILHDWPEDKALRILGACRRAMKPGARLMIVDRLLDADPARCDAYDLLLDMNMLVLHGGQERTAEEFNDLTRRTGFGPIRPVMVQPTFSILETWPAG